MMVKTISQIVFSFWPFLTLPFSPSFLHFHSLFRGRERDHTLLRTQTPRKSTYTNTYRHSLICKREATSGGRLLLNIKSMNHDHTTRICILVKLIINGIIIRGNMSVIWAFFYCTRARLSTLFLFYVLLRLYLLLYDTHTHTYCLIIFFWKKQLN